MRHKYETRGIVLSRTPVGEATASVAILTEDLGLVYARAQSVRVSGAKLAAALATFAESGVVLVRGKEYWRVAGAVLEERWFEKLATPAARVRAAQVSGLVTRLIAGETHDVQIFPIMRGFFAALAASPESEHEAIEILAVLRLLAALGLDAGEIPGTDLAFDEAALASVRARRSHYLSRINTGITASGL